MFTFCSQYYDLSSVQNDIDVVNKKLEALISAAGGKELSPLEIEISTLQKAIKQEQQEIIVEQQAWIREQEVLVNYSGVQNGRSEAIEMLLERVIIILIIIITLYWQNQMTNANRLNYKKGAGENLIIIFIIA